MKFYQRRMKYLRRVMITRACIIIFVSSSECGNAFLARAHKFSKSKSFKTSGPPWIKTWQKPIFCKFLSVNGYDNFDIFRGLITRFILTICKYWAIIFFRSSVIENVLNLNPNATGRDSWAHFSLSNFLEHVFRPTCCKISRRSIWGRQF